MPLNDEIFSSWLSRLAYKSKVSLNVFVDYYLSKELNFWFKDVDLKISSGVISFTKNATLLNDDQVLNMFLYSYEGIVFQSSGTRIIQNFLPTGVGTQYCPGCFNEPIPYFKKDWRLITSVICPKCRCYLVERCPSCNAAITYHKTNRRKFGSKIEDTLPIYVCSDCYFDFRKTNKEVAQFHELEYQKYIDNTLRSGYNRNSHYSFLYFQALFLMAQNLRRPNSKTRRFLNEINEIYNWKLVRTNVNIKFWDSLERRNSLVLAYHLLKDFNLLKDMLKRTNVPRRSIITFKDTAPYWFERIFEDY